MRRAIFALAILAFAAAPALSQTISRGPLIQNPDADATKATFVWWTGSTPGNSTVEYGLTPTLGQSVTMPQASSCEVGNAGTCHTVPVSGLLPDTVYYYRLLTNGTPLTATTYFSTLATPGVNTDFFFTVIGDWGQGTTPEAQIAALQNAADPQMILTVGDNTYYTLLTSQSEFDSRSLAYYASVFPRTFFFPTLGNHDFALTSVSSYTSLPYIKTLALPVNAPAQPERYYSFNSGQAHFTSIDTDSCCDATQTNWLQNDLASSTATWKFGSCTTPPTRARAAARRSAAT